jgi:hypothetical protein
MAATGDESAPLCRIVCIATHAEPLWRWEACDANAHSGMTFPSLHECAEDARQHGFQVDLVRAPLALLPPRAADAL